MVAIQIRDVPEDVRARLAAQAASRGQSLQRYLLDVMSAQARRSDNVALLDRFSHRSDGVHSGAVDTLADLAAVRSARE